MIVQTTKIYKIIENAVSEGYRVISAQGSSRSSKTYNILIFLIAYVYSKPNKSLSIVRKTLPALKGSVFRDFKEIMQDKFKIWDVIWCMRSQTIHSFSSSQQMTNRKYVVEKGISFIVMKQMKYHILNGNNS